MVISMEEEYYWTEEDLGEDEEGEDKEEYGSNEDDWQ